MDIYGYTVNVDEPATRNWYDRAEDWDCPCVRCRNFLALARQRALPEELLALLKGLSIPPEKVVYVCALYHGGDWREKGLLYQLQWRAAGEVLTRPAGGQGGYGPLAERPWGGVRLCTTDDGYAVENFPEPWFTIDCTLYLPWTLDEDPGQDETKEN